MAYIVPQVLVKQEFTQLPVFADAPLAALIVGPQYELHRYSDADEKAGTAVEHPDNVDLTNVYQEDSDVTYSFPNQTPGTVVDPDYTKLNIEDTIVQYYPSDITDSIDPEIARVAHATVSGQYYTNRFSTTFALKTGNDVDRDAGLSGYDVSPGDIVTLRDVDASTETTVKVKALHATKTAASVTSSGTEDDANINTQTEDTNDSMVYTGSNTAPDVGPATVSTGRAYVGYISKRVLSDTYTIEVTTGGALDAAVFKVTSTNGAFAARTGLVLNESDELVIDDVGSNSLKVNFADIERSSGTLLQVGDSWTLGVVAPATSRTPTATGTYTGTEDLTYKLKVVRGGPFYSGSNGTVCAKIAVTSDGNDSSPAVNVASATAFQVGSYGVTAQFASAVADGGLVLGDVYYVTVTAAAPAAIKVVETYEKLPAALLDNSHTFEITTMGYPASLQIPAVDPSDEDLVNWEVDSEAQTITVNQAISTTNSLITYPGGDAMLLPIKGGDLYVTYRALVKTNANSIGAVTAADQVEGILGTIHPDNPLAQGVYKAALNSNGAPVYFSGVLTNDLAGYEAVLANARKDNYYYGVTPLTFDREIQDAIVSHVNAMSTPEAAKWRVAWLSTPITETALIYDVKSTGASWKATITDDPFATGTQYRLVTMDGATFITDGVRATDKLLINFSTNSSGVVEYEEYEVAEVRTETTLALVAGPSAAISVALKAQIQRVYTKDEQINALRNVGGDFDNRRVRMVFPPTAKSGGVANDGYFVAAALAGLRSGVVPHQGLTNTALLGFDDFTLSVSTFTDIQLNRLAEQGFWIVTQSTVGATPYVRHQLTTDATNLNTSEDSVTTNVDSISYGIRRALEPYIGKYNIHPNAVIAVRGSVFGELSYRTTNTYTERAGNQLISFEIVSLEQNATFKDRVNMVVRLEVSYPMNFIDLAFLI